MSPPVKINFQSRWGILLSPLCHCYQARPTGEVVYGNPRPFHSMHLPHRYQSGPFEPEITKVGPSEYDQGSSPLCLTPSSRYGPRCAFCPMPGGLI